MSPRRFATPLLAMMLVLASCSTVTSTFQSAPSPTPTPALRPVTLLLGFRPDVQFAPFYVAQQEGYFADAGLEVTIEHRDGPDVIRLVADGQAEFGVADATDVMISRTSGIPIRYVSTLYARFPVALIGSPDLVPAHPAELAGLRIGTPGRYGSSWVALQAVLAAGGLTPDDVTIREYPAFNQVEGLLNGDVDLITGFRVNEPLQLQAQGFEVKLLTVDEVAPLPGPGLVVGDDLLSSDRAIVADFARAVWRAQQAIAGNIDLGLQDAINEVPAIGEDRETARAVLSATMELWKDGSGDVFAGIDVQVWATGYQTMVDLRLIDGSAPLSEMYDDVWMHDLN
ncbi:MAG TPA: ABC transporter substrate-binding protein [Candidatus Limnocylindrales bacterium]|nr:ABC transporter substrate-binding protein [Candidatus Limnocylindrales bacterium]